MKNHPCALASLRIARLPAGVPLRGRSTRCQREDILCLCPFRPELGLDRKGAAIPASQDSSHISC